MNFVDVAATAPTTTTTTIQNMLIRVTLAWKHYRQGRIYPQRGPVQKKCGGHSPRKKPATFF